MRVSLIVFGVLCCMAGAWAQSGAIGALRVRIIDQDWDVPLAGAMVHVVEAEKRMVSGEDGNVLFDTLPGGSYTLVVSAPGFERKVLSQVVVIPGDAKSEEIRLNGAFTDMEEFVVKDLEITTGASEVTQLNIRTQSSTLMDNVGSDMMSKAGASTAAAALKMITGATIQDGKYAVIRGLGDRYTSTSLNGIRMPNADRDKRAVSMDQIPSALIESVQVTKSFMPDQQGDATSGINIKTKGVPDKTVLQASVSTEYDSNATWNDHFKSYSGGGNGFGGVRGLTRLDFWDKTTGNYPRGGEEKTQGGTTSTDKQFSNEIQNKAPPQNYGFKLAAGDFIEVGDWKFGGLLLGSYSQKYKYRFGIQNALDKPARVKDYSLDPSQQQTVEFSQDEQLWSAGLTLGAKNEYNDIRFTTLYTHQSKDTVELRYKPSLNPDPIVTGVDNTVVGWTPGRPPKPILDPTARRTEQIYSRDFNAVMQYTENANGIMQLAGEHKFSFLNDSVLDWSGSYNMAECIEPDRRQIGGGYVRKDMLSSVNTATYPATPVWSTPTLVASTNYMTAGIERRWQDTREDDLQLQTNYKQPYTVAEGWDGWFKTGLFYDSVARTYRNRIHKVDGGQIPANSETDFTGFSGAVDPTSLGTIFSESMEYDGTQDIMATYLMGRVPLPEWIDLVGGARLENTIMNTKVFPAVNNSSFYIYDKVTEEMVAKYPTAYTVNDLGLIARNSATPGEADASIDQTDILPALAINVKPIEEISLRLTYAETIARPTFKEITPVKYTDYDSSRVFLGNPDLKMSALKNYDARLEWRPDKNKPDIVAVSIFYKTIENPIQYSVRSAINPDVDYIYPENYGNAEIKGLELEARKSFGFLSSYLESFSLGGNMTMQESKVKYREDIRKQLLAQGIGNSSRPMDGQSDILANVNLLFENEATGLNAGLFYNWRGETYAAGDTASPGNYFPAIVENPYGTLDFVIGYKFRFGDNRYSPTWRLGLEFKNLLDPAIETVSRTPYGDFARTSYTMGRIFGISLGCNW
ncbi:MAG: TonB-dependent receptor [bacterium]